MNVSERLDTARAILDRLRRVQLRIDLLNASLHALTLSVIFWLSSVITEAALRLPAGSRLILFSSSLALTAAAFILLLVKTKHNPRLKPGQYAEEWWALKLGQSAPEKLRDRLLNAIQVNRTEIEKKYPTSASLAGQALFLAVADLAEIPLEPVQDRSGNKRSRLALTSSLVLALGCYLLLPQTLTQATSRLLHPYRSFVTPPAFTLAVSTSENWAYRGEAVAFDISAAGAAPREAEFVHRLEGAKEQVSPLRLQEGSCRIEFPGFPASISYHVRSGEIQSPVHRLEIVARPQVAELQYRLIPPGYSRLPIVTGGDNVGDVEALAGSRLEVSLRSNKQLSSGWLIFARAGYDSSHTDSIPLAISGMKGTAQLGLFQEGLYHLAIVDAEGHRNKDPISYRVSILTDNPPMVRIVFPDGDVIAGDDMRIPLQIEADDDFGISRLELAYRLLEQDTSARSMPLKFAPPNAATVASETIWDISQAAMFPGDVIEYWAVVWDNDVVSGPKRAESERRLVRLPSMEEIVAEVEQGETAGLEQAERTLEDARELRDKVSEIVEEMRRNPEVNWEKKREIDDALEQQKNLEQQVQELSKRLDELVEKLEKHDLASTETLEKYQELQNLLAEIATPELQEAMKKLQEAMASMDPEKVRQALEQFDMTREEFLERIERTMNILKQLQLERRMDELVRLTEELLHQQEEILNQLENTAPEELAARQEQLANGMEIINRQLEETGNIAEAAGEEFLADKLDSLLSASKEKNISGQMKQAGSELAQGQKNAGKQHGEQSARDLSELSAGLKQTANELKERNKADLARHLRRIAEELLYVSRSHEKLTDESRLIETRSPRYRDLASEQEDIRAALQSITDRLLALSQETFFITPDLGASLGKASLELDQAILRFSDRNPRSATQPQEQALGEINLSVLKILNILAQLEGASSSTGYDEMMEQLMQMAQNQQCLNQQSMMLPGMEGQPQMPGGGDPFAQMAAQQRALQEQMQQLSEDGQAMQEVLGDLEGIAQSMGEVADDLDDKRMDERTQRLQRQIVSRLLDATRSMKEQEYSKQRESRTGTQVARKPPPQLMFNQDRDALRRDMLRALQEGYTRDYRILVKEYFQNLERLEKK